MDFIQAVLDFSSLSIFMDGGLFGFDYFFFFSIPIDSLSPDIDLPRLPGPPFFLAACLNFHFKVPRGIPLFFFSLVF